ncbi:MAG: protein-disulfide reductase DsbD [Pseudomonadota bacterium]|jgi:thiol:disulfide interchange protein DsbD
MRFLAGLLLLLASFLVHAQEGELLDPEEAFRFSARALDANTIEARYRIADGYYLYRDKLKFALQPGAAVLGAPQLPPGKVKQDEFFGRVESYRGEVVIRLPLKRTGDGAQTVALKAVSQGCADVGVCYPPLAQSVKVSLPAAAVEPPAPSALAPVALQQPAQPSAAAPQEPPLRPDQAFRLTVKARDDHTLVADFVVADGYYLYRDKIGFAVKAPLSIEIARTDLPAGETKDDPNFGKIQVFHKPFQAAIVLKGENLVGRKVTLEAGFQGCKDKGLCYPPQQKTFAVELRAGAAATAVDAAAPDQPAAAGGGGESSKIAGLLKGGGFGLVVASFFGFGLLLALTPCVFPMIPILSGIIAGQGVHLTKARAFGLSLSYVLGMALTYAAAGVAAGLSGTMLSAALQNPWALGVFALVFVALALSMFGFYELQMPTFLQSKLSDTSNRMKGGHVTGVFVMGALSAVIVGPCVAAPLAGALAYISLTRDVWLGGWALFAMALGMGAPLILVGVSAGALLPKTGGWMEAVKAFFGVLLLGVAIWLISPVIPAVAHMLLWAALLIVSAIYLHALDPLPHPARGAAKFWKGVGVIALIAGVALLVGALAGGRDILQPLSGLRAAPVAVAGAAEAGHPKFERVKTAADVERRIRDAAGKPVVLDFYAEWCASCKELERFTFGDAKVQARLRDAVLLQADVTANEEEDKALLKKFGLFGPPGVLFFDKAGKEIEALRLIGYEEPGKFLERLNAALR